MTTSIPQTPTTPLPDAPQQDAAPKRQKFTLTRARDLDARLEAINLRATTTLAELQAVGISPEVEEQNPVRAQLAAIYPHVAAIVENAEAAKEKSSQVVVVLDL